MAKSNGNGKLTQEQFVLTAIETLRRDGYKGIHSVYSGFNQAFRKYFGEGADPVAVTTKMAEAGVIATRFVRGGAMIYLAGDQPAAKDVAGEALAKMGIGK